MISYSLCHYCREPFESDTEMVPIVVYTMGRRMITKSCGECEDTFRRIGIAAERARKPAKASPRRKRSKK